MVLSVPGPLIFFFFFQIFFHARRMHQHRRWNRVVGRLTHLKRGSAIFVSPAGPTGTRRLGGRALLLLSFFFLQRHSIFIAATLNGFVSGVRVFMGRR